MNAAFSKIVRIGESPRNDRSGRTFSTYAKIQYSEDGRLSITGVEGPFPNGDAYGSCGQIKIDPASFSTFAPGWNAELAARFRDIWDRWHLNDMRAGCEHQRAEKWGDDSVEVVTYKLTSEALADRRTIKRRSDKALERDGRAEISESERALLALPYETHAAPDADSAGSCRYEVSKRETKFAGWVRPDEHPRGVLGKACPVCGYKYGSAWLREEVPAEVLAELKALPDADKQPAWV